MTINPINNIESVISQLKPQTVASESPESSFTKVFQDAIENVNNTENAVNQDEIKIATGQSDDIHSVMIDAAKAEMALSLLVQVRNKALDAYNEIMRITL